MLHFYHVAFSREDSVKRLGTVGLDQRVVESGLELC